MSDTRVTAQTSGTQTPRKLNTRPAANPNIAAIPYPTSNINNLAACAESLKEAVESLAGQRGDASNRAVTFNDLIDYGLLTSAAVKADNGKTHLGQGAGGGGGGGSGTVTTITAGIGITVIPSPIVTTGSVALTVPVTVANGGTGATTAPAALTNLGAAPIASPTFTGDPRAPTPAPGDNDTSIATTAYVQSQGYVSGGPLTANRFTMGSGTGVSDSTARQTGFGIETGIGATTEDCTLELGRFRGGSGNAFIDLHATSGTDFEARIIRNIGANGILAIENTGTGVINLNASGGVTVNGAPISPGTTGMSGMTAGQIPIAATATTVTSSANLSGDVVSTATTLATTIQANAVTTTKINNSAVTYAKIQNVANNRVLGNTSGSAAAPSEITLPLSAANGGTGLASGTSGGIPYYNTTTTLASSAVLTANALIKGGGAGAAPVASTATVDGSGNLAVTGAVTVGTPGAVSGGTLASDVVVKRAILNTSTASAPAPVFAGNLQIMGADGTASPSIEMVSATTAVGSGSRILFRRAGTSGASPSAVQSTWQIGGIQGAGYGATGWSNPRGTVQFNATENWTDSLQGCECRIFTTPTGGVATAQAVTIQNGLTVGVPGAVSGGTLFGDVVAQRVFAGSVNLPALIGSAVFQADANIQLEGAGTGVNLFVRRANTSLASPSALGSGDVIGGVLGYGYGTSAYSAAQRASVRFATSEAWTNTAQGAVTRIEGTPTGGTATATVATFQVGVQIGTPTGGDKGAGTVNATGVYVNGASIGDNAAWSTYTPTVTASTGTFTSVSATGRYKILGKIGHITVSVTITTNGTAAGQVNATLPAGVTAASIAVLAGRETAAVGTGLFGTIAASGSTIGITKYDNTYPGANGYVLNVSGIFEVT